MTSRRSFLRTIPVVASAYGGFGVALPQAVASSRRFEPGTADWRTFDVTTRVEMDASAATQVWIPLPSLDTDWQRSLSTSVQGNVAAQLVHDGSFGARMVHSRFDKDAGRAVLEVTSRVRTRDRTVDWNARNVAAEDASTLAYWTRPTALIPTDGLVRAQAREVTRGAGSDREKTLAIYEWVARQVDREPSVRGCGEGDVRAMLQSGNRPSGKCADINALFVGMCRSVGVPARDLYGVRLAPSAYGYRELGASSEKLSGAQHCRAEAYLKGHGWVAMDPADVTKVMRQETAEWIRSVDHPLVSAVHQSLKGCCEGNWMAYSAAHDLVLPGSRGPRMGFLMYPVAETATGRLDSYSPDTFSYRITAREIVA